MTLIPPADVEALAGAIADLAGDPRRLRELGQAARDTVAAAFTWEQCGERTVAAYQEALR